MPPLTGISTCSDLSPAGIVSEYPDDYETYKTRTYQLQCLTVVGSDGTVCGKIGKLEIKMSKSNDSIGERLHSIVFLISPKCSSCKKSMDLVNEAFDAGRSTATILEGSELGDTHIFSRKMSKVGGADLLRHKIAQAYPQRPMVASFVSSRNSFGHNIASEQSRIEEAVRYDWYNVVKNPQSGEGFWTERPTRLKFYFVNVFDHSHALKSLKETYMIDKQNLHMARLESGNLQEMDGGHEGHNTACEEGDAVAQSGRAAADSLSLTRRWFGRGQRSHSLDPRDIPLSSRSFRFAARIPAPSVITPRPPACRGCMNWLINLQPGYQS